MIAPAFDFPNQSTTCCVSVHLPRALDVGHRINEEMKHAAVERSRSWRAIRLGCVRRV